MRSRSAGNVKFTINFVLNLKYLCTVHEHLAVFYFLAVIYEICIQSGKKLRSTEILKNLYKIHKFHTTIQEKLQDFERKN